MSLYKLTVKTTDDKLMTLMTLAQDSEAAVSRIREYLQSNEIEGRVLTVSEKKNITFVG